MKPGIKRAILALGVAVLLLPAAALATPNQGENAAALALIDRVLAVSDIETGNGPAFRLHARFRVTEAPGKFLDGQLLRVWAPPGWWHQEEQMPGYQSVEVSDGKQTWRAGNRDFLPFPIFLIRRALEPGRGLRAAKGKKLGVPARAADSGEECVKTVGDSHAFKYCFDPQSGNLLRLVDGLWNVTFEYSDYQPLGRKRFPRLVRVLRASGALFMEIHIDRLVSERQLNLNVFLPVSGSKAWPTAGHCPAIEKAKLKKMVRPKYPEAAAKAGIIGIVRLYADIGVDGIPRGLWPINSVPPILSDAAIEAVSQWRYQPRTCKSTGKAMPAIVQITALFLSQ